MPTLAFILEDFKRHDTSSIRCDFWLHKIMDSCFILCIFILTDTGLCMFTVADAVLCWFVKDALIFLMTCSNWMKELGFLFPARASFCREIFDYFFH